MFTISDIARINNVIAAESQKGDYKLPLFGNLFCGDRSHKFKVVTESEVDDAVIQRVRHFISTHSLVDEDFKGLIERRPENKRNKRFVVKPSTHDTFEKLRHRRGYFEQMAKAESVEKFKELYSKCRERTPICEVEYKEILLHAISLAARLNLSEPVFNRNSEHLALAAGQLVDVYNLAVASHSESSIPHPQHFVRQVHALQTDKVCANSSKPHAHSKREVVKEVLTETTIDSLPVIGPTVNFQLMME